MLGRCTGVCRRRPGPPDGAGRQVGGVLIPGGRHIFNQPSFFHASYLAFASAESHMPGRAVLHGPIDACAARGAQRWRRRVGGGRGGPRGEGTGGLPGGGGAPAGGARAAGCGPRRSGSAAADPRPRTWRPGGTSPGTKRVRPPAAAPPTSSALLPPSHWARRGRSAPARMIA